MSSPTQPLRTTADRLLRRDHGMSLDEFVLPRRGSGEGWRRIAVDLALATDGVLNVTGEAIRLWFGESEPTAA